MRRLLLLAPLALLAAAGPAWGHGPFRPRAVYVVPVQPAVPVAPVAPAVQAPAPLYLTPGPSYYLRPLLLHPWYAAPAAPPQLVAPPPAPLAAELVVVPPGAQAARAPAEDLDATLRRLTAQMGTLASVVEIHTARINEHEQRLQAVESWWKSKAARDGK